MAKLKRGDYSAAQHCKIMQLENTIRMIVEAYENASPEVKSAIATDGHMCYAIVDARSKMKNFDYGDDYQEFINFFNKTGFTK